jgi:hypothetical protein
MTDKNKTKLREYLQRRNIEINFKKKPPVFRCPNPSHADKKPSAILYEKSTGDNCFCPVCDQTWDIYDVAGLIENLKEFPDKKKAVEKILNIQSEIKNTNTEKKTIKSVPLSIDEARKQYNSDRFIEMAKKANWGNTIVGHWIYYDKDGNIIGVDVRFENDKKEKTVINFWYNGKSVVAKNSPVMIYGLYEALKNPDKSILITEGCKTAEASRQLKKYVPVSWNRGTPNAKNIDWSVFKDRTVYIFPDDDTPGIKAAIEIQKQLPQAKILNPIPEARKIKPKGADIVEILQIMSIDKIIDYIENSPPLVIEENKQKSKTDDFEENQQKNKIESISDLPFRALGIADDNKAYFLDRHNRMLISSLDTLGAGKLLTLAPIAFWSNEFGHKGRINWQDAQDFVIEFCGNIDFSIDKIRGRGAWKESDGKICYHDGKNTIGEFNGKYLFLRKNKIDIGLNDEPATKEICQQIAKVVNEMSFESKLDTIRCLAWSTLAPFAGALPWRPAALVTGSSGSGKTTAIDYVVKKIAKPLIFSGADTTSAAIRQIVRMDSTAIVLEEVEADTQKKRQNRQELFSLMRQSTSDDAPIIGKGTKEQTGIIFNMTNMFMFVAVSPEVESIADDNRIFRINMIKPIKKWGPIKKNLKTVLTNKNCRAIRSLTWQKLKSIINLAENLTPIIQEITNKNTRSSFAESLFFATYFLIWQGRKKIEDEEAKGILSDLFSKVFQEHERNEVEEILDRLLDQSVFLSESKTTKTLREILNELRYEKHILLESNKDEYEKTIGHYGLKVDSNGYISIAINHHEIMKIIDRGIGYQRIFWRHPGLIERSKNVRIAGKSRRCLILSGILEKDDSQEIQEEIPF